MNRRNLLKGVLGLGAVGVAGKVVADEKPFYGPGIPEMGLAPLKREGAAIAYDELEERYWDAQRHIDELYIDRQGTLEIFDAPPGPQKMTFFDDEGRSVDMYFDGDNFVIDNHVSGNKVTV